MSTSAINVGPQVARIVNHYASLTEDVLDRYKVAAEESKNGTYSPQRLFSDVMASWCDMMRALSYPMKWYEAVQAEVIVPITLDPTQSESVGVIAIGDPGAAPLSVDQLTTKASNSPALSATAYFVDRPRPTLVVIVPTPSAMPASGTYAGFVRTADGRRPALVEVKVP